MHGAGNDYIYVNTSKFPLENPEELAVRWSAWHTGIGADGLVLIGTSETADFSMRIFNADGSEALMCGNATRCIGKYVYENKLTDKTTLTLETLSGIKELKLMVENETVTEVSVDMGKPVTGETALNIEAGGRLYTGTVVSMGNPHFVIFVDDMSRVNLPVVGPLLENHPSFPDRTNVEFVQVENPAKIKMRVWERGSGITMACGTGACAGVVAAVINGKTQRTTQVEMDGGTLSIRWDETSGRVFKTGNAVTVFEGIINI
jgi:diaminopimelate epimerase